MLIVFVIGDVLGAGIYALVGEVGGEVGGAIWASFLFAGVLAIFTATLLRGARDEVPAGGRRRPVREPRLQESASSRSSSRSRSCRRALASAATLATAFGGDYLSEFVDLPQVLVGLVFIVVIALINFRGDPGVGDPEPRADDDRGARPAAGGGDRARPSCSTAAATRAARSSSRRARRCRWRSSAAPRWPSSR